MLERSSKSKLDANRLAKFVIDDTTTKGLIDKAVEEGKNPAAVLLGRLGGLRGGKARAEKLSVEERKEIAKKAAMIRWSTK